MTTEWKMNCDARSYLLILPHGFRIVVTNINWATAKPAEWMIYIGEAKLAKKYRTSEQAKEVALRVAQKWIKEWTEAIQ